MLIENGVLRVRAALNPVILTLPLGCSSRRGAFAKDGELERFALYARTFPTDDGGREWIRLEVEPQVGLPRRAVGSVARYARVEQDRPDVAVEVGAGCRHGGRERRGSDDQQKPRGGVFHRPTRKEAREQHPRRRCEAQGRRTADSRGARASGGIDRRANGRPAPQRRRLQKNSIGQPRGPSLAQVGRLCHVNLGS